MSARHELVGTATAMSPNLEGSIDVKEIECDGIYVTVTIDANYCSRCGEEL